MVGNLQKLLSDGHWTYGYCESCMKNSHSEIKMIREKVSSEFESVEMWVCVKCGSTKKL